MIYTSELFIFYKVYFVPCIDKVYFYRAIFTVVSYPFLKRTSTESKLFLQSKLSFCEVYLLKGLLFIEVNFLKR